MTMRRLFGPEGGSALAALVARRPLLAFDFDGTLAPIVPRPDDARVPTALARRLARLATLRPVAIVTGRSVADVSDRLGFEPTYVVGNHGAEDPQRPPPAAAPAALDTLRRRLEAQGPALHAAGVVLEDKRHSLTLHYRLARDRGAALAAIDQALQALDGGLRRFGGKCVVNIVAADGADKADAVFTLVERSRSEAALFVGDDVNDEAVFRRAPPHWLTVRVGLDDTASQARFFVDGTPDVAQLLDQLLAALAPPPG